MEHIQNRREAPAPSYPFSFAVWQLRESIERCLMNRGVGRTCNVMVHQKGHVLELTGNVDSEWTHCEILAMVPDEERCVVDNIKVVPLPI
jgi:hypothetical protein